MKTRITLVSIDQKKAVIYVLGGITEGKINEITAENNTKVQYYKAIEHEVKDFKGLVLAGHGRGSANESHNFKVYLEKKNKPLWHKILGELVTDYHETEKQLLARSDELVGQEHIGHHNG